MWLVALPLCAHLGYCAQVCQFAKVSVLKWPQLPVLRASGACKLLELTDNSPLNIRMLGYKIPAEMSQSGGWPSTGRC